MRRMIYGVAFTASIVGAYADYCPETLTQQAMDMLASRPTRLDKTGEVVPLGGQTYRIESDEDKKVIEKALDRTGVKTMITRKHAHKTAKEEASALSGAVTCQYQYRSESQKKNNEPYFKFKISRDLSKDEHGALTGGKIIRGLFY